MVNIKKTSFLLSEYFYRFILLYIVETNLGRYLDLRSINFTQGTYIFCIRQSGLPIFSTYSIVIVTTRQTEFTGYLSLHFN